MHSDGVWQIAKSDRIGHEFVQRHVCLFEVLDILNPAFYALLSSRKERCISDGSLFVSILFY
jgi:hypothetical protein